MARYLRPSLEVGEPSLLDALLEAAFPREQDGPVEGLQVWASLSKHEGRIGYVKAGAREQGSARSLVAHVVCRRGVQVDERIDVALFSELGLRGGRRVTVP